MAHQAMPLYGSYHRSSCTPCPSSFLSSFLWSGRSVASFHSCGTSLVRRTYCSNPGSSNIVSATVPLVLERFSTFLNKSPCLLCFMSSSSSVYFSFHYLSLSALVALLTRLHKVRYSCRLSTSVRCSCHLANICRFFSTNSIVSVENRCLCSCHLP